jgi:hypothetical protein
MSKLNTPRDFVQRQFIAVVSHFCAHRPTAAGTARALIDNHATAAWQGKSSAYFTHVNLASRRGDGRLHRNTTRDTIRELVAAGFLKVEPYRKGMANRFFINWSRVLAYFKGRELSLVRTNREAGKIRTAAQHEQRMRRHLARVEAKRKADAEHAERQRREKLARDAADAATSDDRAEFLAGMRAALRAARGKRDVQG